MSGRLLTMAATIAAALCVGGSAAATPRDDRYAGAPHRVAGLLLPARVQGTRVALARRGAFAPRFWPGVNLGSTVPGFEPGEVAATRPMYDRWLTGMGDLGVRVVRIYTILKPDFYDALAAYNRRHADAPIRVIHGVWIPEAEFLATQNLYDPAVADGFRAEIADAVAVVHGRADRPRRVGHAHGRYRSDVSKWVLAWSIGVEWDPRATEASDRANAGAPPFSGRYFTAARDATPTESWIASMLDHLAGLEAARGWSRPLTFTNWLTVDPLNHPEEPLEEEDLVTVDAANIAATAAWPAGFFASYHAYPYYPDFMRYEPGLQASSGPDGRPDPYLGLIRALRAHHAGQALMITELGVPTSIGSAHDGPRGRDQGGHSERRAAAIQAEMLTLLKREGLAGGLLFEWLDEWFKFTWNTIDYEIPAERRQLWRNALTNEEHFGIVATEAGAAPIVTLDGRDSEWRDGQSRSILTAAGRGVREVRVAHDPAYVHLLLRLDRPGAWRSRPVRIGFDVRPGGNGGLPGRPGVDTAADVALVVGPGNRARISQAAWTEPVAIQYGLVKRYFPVDPATLTFESGVWTSPQLILNRPYTVPPSGVQRPVELMDLGRLRWGTADPSSPRFDNRNLVMGSGRVLEIRIPWALLTFSDPSSHLALVPETSGTLTTTQVTRLGMGVAGGGGPARRTRGYAWDGWNSVRWHERRKAGWPILQRSFALLARS